MSILDEVVDQAYSGLTDKARDYLLGRGVTSTQVRDFRIGYTPTPLTFAGAPKMYDSLIFPLTTSQGVVKGLQFKSLKQKLYRDYFANQEEPILLGLGQALPHIWDAQSVWLVEGAFDLFPLQRFRPNSVSTLSATVSVPLFRLLKRLVKEVWMLYDMDAPGRRAAYAFQKEAKGILKVHVVSPPRVKLREDKRAKDPGDLWYAWGDSKLQEYLDSVDRR